MNATAIRFIANMFGNNANVKAKLLSGMKHAMFDENRLRQTMFWRK